MSVPAIDSWTSSREPAQQTSPWLKKIPLTIPSTAWSSGASSKTMLAALPPSSRVSALPLPGDALGDQLADGRRAGEGDLVDTRMADERPCPISPGPVTMLTTPGRQVGLAADLGEEERGERRVDEAGLRTTVLPGARAGAIFQASIRSGKFQGMTWAATPSGRATRPGKA